MNDFGTKVMVELEWEQIDSITTNNLKEARDELARSLELNVRGLEYMRVYYNGVDDPDGSKDRKELIGMLKSFNDVLNYYGVS